LVSGSILGLSCMNDFALGWFFVAILVFWFVGAYNRLVRLRSKAIVSFLTLEQLFDQYITAVRMSDLASDHQRSLEKSELHREGFWVSWQGLSAAADQFAASLRASHLRPLDEPTINALKTAHDTLMLSWERLRNLPPDLSGHKLPDEFQIQWAHIAAQVEVTQSEFNRLVLEYNEAIGQFPALLLAWIFDFRRAQPI
jgi:LemA protein